MLDDLIPRLRASQQQIVSSIDQIQSSLRSYQEAKPKIRELSDKLLGHFGQQNDALFDQLMEENQADRQALKMIEFLRHDLKNFKITFLIFFDKHSGEMADMSARTFPLDFTQFSRDILTRLNIEEEHLFPLISKSI